MERTKVLRGLRIAASAMCGVVCVLLVVLWVRSYSHEDVASYVDSRSRTLHFISWQGAVSLSGANHDPSKAAGSWRLYVAWEPGILGFDRFSTARSWSFKAPHWFPVLLFATLAAAPWIRWSFSLRTLLIATTVLTLMLGLAVWSLRS